MMLTRELETKILHKRGHKCVVDIINTEEIGQPGLPWSGGRLRLEHSPDLQPLTARGRGGDPGEYFAIARSTAQVRAALSEAVTSVAATPWRIEEPQLVEWADCNHVHARARHWAFCQR
ncbi:MAG: hypothetical protein ACPG77_08245, partial [Nannocystaceae bacterium]